ncbi:MAG: hypothetical protein JSS42_13420, partial [Proteobacteria bacterium]|nr:hypothetical protein [Pseudomonadota bacterium]
TPLKQIFDELKARADAGDAEAASRLFHDTQQCKHFLRIRRTVPQLAQYALDEKVEGASADQLKSSDAVLGMAQDQLKFLRENASLCNGLSDDIGNSTLPLALQAAQLGDAAATDCYVAGGSDMGMPAGLLDHPEWLSEYKKSALPMANAAVENGDWTMVSQLAWAYQRDFASNLLSQATGHDPAMAYRYLKLALLGAPSADRDKGVAMLQSTLNGLAGEISANQKADADTWAQNAYQSYFRTNPNNPSYNSYKACPLK